MSVRARLVVQKDHHVLIAVLVEIERGLHHVGMVGVEDTDDHEGPVFRHPAYLRGGRRAAAST